jgi:acetyl esterase
MTAVDPAQNPKNEASQSFFKPSTLGGGKPLEILTPPDARAVLVNAQGSVSQELPPCDIEHKTVTQDGLNVDLTVVRPYAATKRVVEHGSEIHAEASVSPSLETASEVT